MHMVFHFNLMFNTVQYRWMLYICVCIYKIQFNTDGYCIFVFVFENAGNGTGKPNHSNNR